jgi:hypothetical protein
VGMPAEPEPEPLRDEVDELLKGIYFVGPEAAAMMALARLALLLEREDAEREQRERRERRAG